MAGAFNAAILRAAALLVPASGRADWLAEWKAELWYIQDDATAFCLGSFRDALWLRCHSFGVRRALRFESPLCCVLFLVGLNVLTLVLVPLPRTLWLHEWTTPDAKRFLAGMFWMYLESLLVLVSVVPVECGGYDRERHGRSLLVRVRRWTFLATKIVLLPPIMFLLAFALVPVFPLAPLLLLVALIFGFRWALADQRRRCPVCLRHLPNVPEDDISVHLFAWTPSPKGTR